MISPPAPDTTIDDVDDPSPLTLLRPTTSSVDVSSVPMWPSVSVQISSPLGANADAFTSASSKNSSRHIVAPSSVETSSSDVLVSTAAMSPASEMLTLAAARSRSATARTSSPPLHSTSPPRLE